MPMTQSNAPQKLEIELFLARKEIFRFRPIKDQSYDLLLAFNLICGSNSGYQGG